MYTILICARGDANVWRGVCRGMNACTRNDLCVVPVNHEPIHVGVLEEPNQIERRIDGRMNEREFVRGHLAKRISLRFKLQHLDLNSDSLCIEMEEREDKSCELWIQFVCVCALRQR